MNTKFSVSTLASVACVAALTLGASGAAQAQDDIFWSIGMASPGVRIGISNAPAVVVQPPIYVQPRPYYVVPRPVVYMPPPPVVYGYPGWGHRFQGGHEGYRGYGYRGQERFEHERGGRGEGRGEGRSEGRGEGRGEGRRH
jgi:hypothetical protein